MKIDLSNTIKELDGSVTPLVMGISLSTVLASVQDDKPAFWMGKAIELYKTKTLVCTIEELAMIRKELNNANLPAIIKFQITDAIDTSIADEKA